MKILLTTDTWAPTVNGVVTSTMALRAELQARGHEVRVLTLSGNGHTHTQEGVTYLGSLDAGLVYPGARLRAPALSGRRSGTDGLVPRCGAFPVRVQHLCPGAADCQSGRCPAAAHLPHRLRGLHPLLFPQPPDGASAGGAVHPQHLRRLRRGHRPHAQNPVAAARVQRTPPGVCDSHRAGPGAFFRGARSGPAHALDLPQDAPVLLYLGRLAKEKNIHELLEAMPHIARGVLLIVGDGPERPAWRLRPGNWAWGTGSASPAW